MRTPLPGGMITGWGKQIDDYPSLPELGEVGPPDYSDLRAATQDAIVELLHSPGTKAGGEFLVLFAVDGGVSEHLLEIFAHRSLKRTALRVSEIRDAYARLPELHGAFHEIVEHGKRSLESATRLAKVVDAKRVLKKALTLLGELSVSPEGRAARTWFGQGR